MANFNDRMMAFTDRLGASIEARGDSLAEVHQATVDLLGGAREFLESVATEHGARAEELGEFLSKTRADREEAVNAMRENHREFLDEVTAAHGARTEEVNEFLSSSRAHRIETVGAMRDAHRESLGAMRDELRHTLDETNKIRHEVVGMMTGSFRTARSELSSDLGTAARTWREFAARRTRNTPATQPEAPAHEDRGKTAKPSQKPRSQGRRAKSHSG
ncbi:hypothetical protein P12x_005991 (plasmid) [Tundrisphaera lichenicola]|uniref:hypothetical protein n=1 Tax=Tundrisphaera lichenicola TaxID=2029860 RepID=UPI003EC02D8F